MNAEQKEKAKSIYQLQRRLMLTTGVLGADVRFAEGEWRKDKSSQFWRRTIIRCLCALVEGSLGLFKSVAPKIAAFFEIPLNDKDHAVATERRTWIEGGIAKTRRKFLPFPDNVKETLKLFAKAHAIQTPVRCDDSGFKDLCNTFELRNRLMHPKGPFDVEVKDDAIETAIRGMSWFDATVQNLLEQCKTKLPFSKS